MRLQMLLALCLPPYVSTGVHIHIVTCACIERERAGYVDGRVGGPAFSLF